MNLAQKIVIWIGLVLIGGMTIYPPWVQRFKPPAYLGIEPDFFQPTERYYWIFRQPDYVGDFSDPGLNWCWTPRLDVARLLVRWSAVIIVTKGLTLTFRVSK